MSTYKLTRNVTPPPSLPPSLPHYLLEPLGLGINGHQKEVGVHDSMHRVVHRDEVDTRMPCGVGGPREAQDSHVVVPVREGGRVSMTKCHGACLFSFPPFPLPASLPPYQCKKIGVRPFKQTNIVSKSSMSLERVNNKHHSPEAPSPFII